jgi:hypothetical protein
VKLDRILPLFFLGILAVLTGPILVRAQQGSFTPIDVPGAFDTEASGINDAGQIVGRYNNLTQNFLLAGGSFTPIDVPGATFTLAYGINNAGQIVGY